jgi:hypothetical protein
LRTEGSEFIAAKEHANPSGHMELGGTSQRQLVFLNTHWGSKYSFAPPEAPGGQWTATAKFGRYDQIQEWSAAQLLEEIRDHYKTNATRSGQE